MAEAFGRVFGLGVIEAYSAGTEMRESINQAAVRIMKEIGIDMELLQKPKLLTDIPAVDIVVTMGCNVTCPFLPCQHREDWGLEDPSGKSDEEFRLIRDRIKVKLQDLLQRIESGAL
jgi:Protein-tyrosine-phosphatase